VLDVVRFNFLLVESAVMLTCYFIQPPKQQQAKGKGASAPAKKKEGGSGGGSGGGGGKAKKKASCYRFCLLCCCIVKDRLILSSLARTQVASGVEHLFMASIVCFRTSFNIMSALFNLV
jgi:hypothetical protein